MIWVKMICSMTIGQTNKETQKQNQVSIFLENFKQLRNLILLQENCWVRHTNLLEFFQIFTKKRKMTKSFKKTSLWNQLRIQIWTRVYCKEHLHHSVTLQVSNGTSVTKAGSSSIGMALQYSAVSFQHSFTLTLPHSKMISLEIVTQLNYGSGKSFFLLI